MKIRVLLLGAAAMLALGTANAGHHHGWYVGIEGGANWVDDLEGEAFVRRLRVPVSFEADTGWAALGTVGYSFRNNWRLELEGGYRSNRIDALSAKLNEWSIMANAVYDIHLSPKWDLSLGAGAGYDRATLKDGGASVDDGNFAYQGIAGLSYAIGRQTDLTLTYRYLRVSEPEFNFGGVSGYTLDDVSKHTLTIGLRFDLSPDEVAAPPVALPPPPPPPQSYEPFVIFFGFGKCNITPEANAVLSEAASAARRGGAVSVRVVGHTDTVGSSRSNQRLSECRANATKANLVGKGVPSGSISTAGRGESEPMVQTGDGVKEPQNRRVTIDLN